MIIPTPALCPSSLPALMILYPCTSLSCTPVQCVSAIPITSHLSLSSSLIRQVTAPVALSVLTFHVPTVMTSLAVSKCPFPFRSSTSSPPPLVRFGFRHGASFLLFPDPVGTPALLIGTLTRV